MIFDFVKELTLSDKDNKKFGGAESLYEYCLAALRNVRTNPDYAMFNIRKALETLVWSLLMEDGNVVLGEKEELYKLINTYAKPKQCRFIKYKRVRSLHDLRKSISNNYMHIYVDDKGQEGYEIVGEHATWLDAFDKLKLLNECLRSIFGLKDTELREIDCPIGDYQLVRSIRATDYEALEGNYKYIGKMSEEVGMDTYAYIRPYHAQQDNVRDVFNERDVETQTFIKNMRGSRHIVQGFKIPTEEYCIVRYMAYNIYENTQTLDETVENGLATENLLDIILQVAQGLSDLITDKIKIHHRGIRPTCIFVTPFGDDFLAQIGCFETAKIEYTVNERETISREDLLRVQRANAFVHPKLLGKPEGVSDRDWEAGDVYSLAMIFLSCIDKQAVEGNNKNCTVLLNYFSDQFFDEMELILCTESLEVIPSMKKFCSILEEEKHRLNYM